MATTAVADCQDLARRIKSLEQDGIPAKIAQSKRSNTPLAEADQAAVETYLTAGAAHLRHCRGLATGRVE